MKKILLMIYVLVAFSLTLSCANQEEINKIKQLKNQINELSNDPEQKDRNQAVNTASKIIGTEPSTGDLRQDEINWFKRIVNKNTGPSCNIYGVAPCPDWPNYIKELVKTVSSF